MQSRGDLTSFCGPVFVHEVKLKGNEEEIFTERDQKLEFARERRKAKRNAKRSTSHEKAMVCRSPVKRR